MPFIITVSRYGHGNPEHWDVYETTRETKAFWFVPGWSGGDRRIAKDEVSAVRETKAECEALRTAGLEAWERHAAERRPLTDELRRLYDLTRDMDKARDAELAAILKGGAT